MATTPVIKKSEFYAPNKIFKNTDAFQLLLRSLDLTKWCTDTGTATAPATMLTLEEFKRQTSLNIDSKFISFLQTGWNGSPEENMQQIANLINQESLFISRCDSNEEYTALKLDSSEDVIKSFLALGLPFNSSELKTLTTKIRATVVQLPHAQQAHGHLLCLLYAALHVFKMENMMPPKMNLPTLNEIVTVITPVNNNLKTLEFILNSSSDSSLKTSLEKLIRESCVKGVDTLTNHVKDTFGNHTQADLDLLKPNMINEYLLIDVADNGLCISNSLYTKAMCDQLIDHSFNRAGVAAVVQQQNNRRANIALISPALTPNAHVTKLVAYLTIDCNDIIPVTYNNAILINLYIMCALFMAFNTDNSLDQKLASFKQFIERLNILYNEGNIDIQVTNVFNMINNIAAQVVNMQINQNCKTNLIYNDVLTRLKRSVIASITAVNVIRSYRVLVLAGLGNFGVNTTICTPPIAQAINGDTFGNYINRGDLIPGVGGIVQRNHLNFMITQIDRYIAQTQAPSPAETQLFSPILLSLLNNTLPDYNNVNKIAQLNDYDVMKECLEHTINYNNYHDPTNYIKYNIPLADIANNIRTIAGHHQRECLYINQAQINRVFECGANPIVHANVLSPHFCYYVIDKCRSIAPNTNFDKLKHYNTRKTVQMDITGTSLTTYETLDFWFKNLSVLINDADKSKFINLLSFLKQLFQYTTARRFRGGATAQIRGIDVNTDLHELSNIYFTPSHMDNLFKYKMFFDNLFGRTAVLPLTRNICQDIETLLTSNVEMTKLRDALSHNKFIQLHMLLHCTDQTISSPVSDLLSPDYYNYIVNSTLTPEVKMFINNVLSNPANIESLLLKKLTETAAPWKSYTNVFPVLYGILNTPTNSSIDQHLISGLGCSLLSDVKKHNALLNTFMGKVNGRPDKQETSNYSNLFKTLEQLHNLIKESTEQYNDLAQLATIKGNVDSNTTRIETYIGRMNTLAGVARSNRTGVVAGVGPIPFDRDDATEIMIYNMSLSDPAPKRIYDLGPNNTETTLNGNLGLSYDLKAVVHSADIKRTLQNKGLILTLMSNPAVDTLKKYYTKMSDDKLKIFRKIKRSLADPKCTSSKAENQNNMAVIYAHQFFMPVLSNAFNHSLTDFAEVSAVYAKSYYEIAGCLMPLDGPVAAPVAAPGAAPVAAATVSPDIQSRLDQLKVLLNGGFFKLNPVGKLEYKLGIYTIKSFRKELENSREKYLVEVTEDVLDEEHKQSLQNILDKHRGATSTRTPDVLHKYYYNTKKHQLEVYDTATKQMIPYKPNETDDALNCKTIGVKTSETDVTTKCGAFISDCIQYTSDATDPDVFTKCKETLRSDDLFKEMTTVEENPDLINPWVLAGILKKLRIRYKLKNVLINNVPFRLKQFDNFDMWLDDLVSESKIDSADREKIKKNKYLKLYVNFLIKTANKVLPGILENDDTIEKMKQAYRIAPESVAATAPGVGPKKPFGQLFFRRAKQFGGAYLPTDHAITPNQITRRFNKFNETLEKSGKSLAPSDKKQIEKSIKDYETAYKNINDMDEILTINSKIDLVFPDNSILSLDDIVQVKEKASKSKSKQSKRLEGLLNILAKMSNVSPQQAQIKVAVNDNGVEDSGGKYIDWD